MKILIINGANLNMLKYRDSNVYGNEDFDSLNNIIIEKYKELNIDFFYSNFEGEIIEKIHSIIIENNYDALIINPGAYSHYSIAILDALEILQIPKVEVHLSDVLCREEFRKTLITKEGCDRFFSGKGIYSYIDAIEYCLSHSNK